ncbi:hypothetical protein ANCCAN_14571, partial [Ancylostoma caninum]
MRMRRRDSLFAYLIQLVTSWYSVQSYCVMYDVCHIEQSSPMNCRADENSTARPIHSLSEDAAKKLEYICPHLLEGNNGICCSSAQVLAMSKQLRQAGSLLERCPSCYDNFQKLWCEFTCSPRQHMFMEILQEVDVPETNISYINKVRYNVSKDFSDALYNSCKDVSMTGSSTKAIRLMCGSLKKNEECTIDNWLKFMGTQNHRIGIPLGIEFNLIDSKQGPDEGSDYFMSVPTTPCHMSPRYGRDKCSRQDCAAVQVVDLFPRDEGTKEVCQVLGMGCKVFLLFGSLFIFAGVLIFMGFLHLFHSTSTTDSGLDRMDYKLQSVNTNMGRIRTMGAWIQDQLKYNGEMFGRFVVQHAWFAFLFGSFIAVISISGNVFLKFTNDPLEMWTSAHSLARQEKRVFEQSFGPFYRVEQIIMYPKSLEQVVDGPHGIRMGAVFHKTFMNEAFIILSRILGISATMADGRRVTLDDVCFRPMGHDYDCLIFSPTNYFQEVCQVLGMGCKVFLLFGSLFIFAGVLIFMGFLHLFHSTSTTDSGLDRMDYKSVNTNMGRIRTMGAWIQDQLKYNGEMFGRFVVQHAWFAFLFGSFIAVISISGNVFLKFTNDPLEMWTSAHSLARQEKRVFEQSFGPFYRVEQIIMYPKSLEQVVDGPHGIRMGAVFHKTFMNEAFIILSRILGISATMADGRRVTLDDVCFRPMGHDYDCLIFSPTNYFQQNASLLNISITAHISAQPDAESDDLDYYADETEAPQEKIETRNYLDHIYDCIENPYNIETSTNMSCLGTFGGPIFPELIFGGASESSQLTDSNALIITIPLNGKSSNLKKAMAWEQALNLFWKMFLGGIDLIGSNAFDGKTGIWFINLMKDYKHEDIQVSFMAERSISDEIERENSSDVYTVLISCILMIGYVAFALGQYIVTDNNLLSLLVHSKIIAGVAGVGIIMCSAASSIGVFSLYGIGTSKAALVVLVFVVLAVGVNRIFIIVQAYQRLEDTGGQSVEDRIARVCGQVMPSMLLSTLSESLCFFVGAISDMPAVRGFSLFAGLAVIFDFVFQNTIFLAIFVWDCKREEACSRWEGKPELMYHRKLDTERVESEGYVYEVMGKYAAPQLMRKWMRMTVLVVFILWFCCSLCIFP